MPTELGYFTIPVTNIARAKTFYGGLFDWRFAADADERYAHVENTTVPLGLVAQEAGSLVNLYFRVDDMQATLARVRALGGQAEEPQASPSGLGAVCRDDGGTAFSVWQPAAGY
jgi:uncharacterized protein